MLYVLHPKGCEYFINPLQSAIFDSLAIGVKAYAGTEQCSQTRIDATSAAGLWSLRTNLRASTSGLYCHRPDVLLSVQNSLLLWWIYVFIITWKHCSSKIIFMSCVCSCSLQHWTLFLSPNNFHFARCKSSVPFWILSHRALVEHVLYPAKTSKVAEGTFFSPSLKKK